MVTSTDARPVLGVDPIPRLCAAGDSALIWAVRNDLQRERVDPRSLWDLEEAQRLLRRQRADGSWPYGGGSAHIRSEENYDQLATYQTLLQLVARYRFDVRHPAIARAAEFLLSFQTEEGDLRGIYGSQYSPNYTAGMVAVLVDAGLINDWRIDKAYRWLLSMRQDDGGWVLPFRTCSSPECRNFRTIMRRADPVQPNRTRPFSHLITGIVLRAFAAHPSYRNLPEIRQAALLLPTRFFKSDPYPDRASATFWQKFAFPFRWTDLVSALDALTQIGITADEPHVASAFHYLAEQQRSDGLWHSWYEHPGDKRLDFWVSFAIARLFQRQGAAR